MTYIVLVTGGTSGIGYECCRALMKQGNTHVIVIGRNAERLKHAVETLQLERVEGTSVEGHVTDLSNLNDTRQLANWVITQRKKVFALICNAGVESPPVSKSVDGFEMTFATNHLGHFLLATSLHQSGMFMKEDKARIVILSSSLHDSNPPPDVSDWNRIAFGDETQTSRSIYARTKLLNVLFGYEFQRQFGSENMSVYLYSPGFVPDTGLFRNHSSLGWWIIKTLLKTVAYFRSDLDKKMSTPARSGAFLARLARDRALPWDSGSYFSIDHLYHSSEQSHDPQLASQLWERSLQWIDI